MPAVIDLYFDGIAYVIQTSVDNYFAVHLAYYFEKIFYNE
ncbi:hypothetical protein wVul_0709 [Wolbachia endosymbiont of Armadillidium vulgare str. wVulC]|nr:hypothetical protein wVul_1608 [Wolbachia endosymbiont of Armadillidium vulgare str. wVulC]KLT22790.1 hypothetical protein wVul_0709 [Wolbachia endosymbiont of Armadillidium vulgare str. wVulC]